MKTKLPKSIDKLDDAKELFEELHKNGEAYHPDDDAHDICGFIDAEWCDQMNDLMDQIFDLEEIKNGDFCPYGFLMDLHNNN